MRIRLGRSTATAQAVAPGWLEKTPSEDCGHGGRRGKFRDGYFSKWCQMCVDAFNTMITKWKTKQAHKEGTCPF